MDFKEIKNIILSAARAKSACPEGYREADMAETPDRLINVIKKHFAWCWQNEVINTEILDHFGQDFLLKHYIYTSGEHNIAVCQDCHIILANSSATVKALENSSAKVLTMGKSSATIRTWDNSSATVETRNDSSATVETRNDSSATVETMDNSSATIRTWDNSSATVETWDNSSATIQTRNDSSATIQTWANSIVRDITNKKIHVHKSRYALIDHT